VSLWCCRRWPLSIVVMHQGDHVIWPNSQSECLKSTDVGLFLAFVSLQKTPLGLFTTGYWHKPYKSRLPFWNENLVQKDWIFTNEPGQGFCDWLLSNRKHRPYSLITDLFLFFSFPPRCAPRAPARRAPAAPPLSPLFGSPPPIVHTSYEPFLVLRDSEYR
jgi:hypothetical protein